MGIFRAQAEFLHAFLMDISKDDYSDDYRIVAATKKFIDSKNIKTLLFNICTIVMIVSAVRKCTGEYSTQKALFVGTCSYMGRKIVDESYDVGCLSLLTYLRPNFLKPSPWIMFGNVVLFYKFVLIPTDLCI